MAECAVHVGGGALLLVLQLWAAKVLRARALRGAARGVGAQALSSLPGSTKDGAQASTTQARTFGGKA